MTQRTDAEAAVRPPLRVAVVSRPDAADEHVLRALGRAADVCQVLVATPPPHAARDLAWARRRLATARPRELGRIARGIVLDRLEARTDRQVRHLLPGGPSPFADARAITPADLNGDAGAALLAGAAPDLLVLSTAPILRERIFTIPRYGTVNVHWGIASRYRGEDTVFQPLQRREYDAIGVTLHHVDAGIDTGPVLAVGRPALAPTDTLATLWAKLAMVAATSSPSPSSTSATGRCADGSRAAAASSSAGATAASTPTWGTRRGARWAVAGRPHPARGERSW